MLHFFIRMNLREILRICAIAAVTGGIALVIGCASERREADVAEKSRAAAIDVVSLPPGVRRALAGYDPGFFVTGCRDDAYVDTGAREDEGARLGDKQTPGVNPTFTVEGDFNGDGAQDLAVLGMTEGHRALLALFCAGDQCSVTEVERWPRTSRGGCEHRLYLTAEKPGMKRSPRESRSLNLKNDAVRIYYDRAAQAILYFQNDGFYSYIMHD